MHPRHHFRCDHVLGARVGRLLRSDVRLAVIDAAREHQRRLFVFGGRRGGNFVTNGFADVMVFDPVSGSWESSGDPGSTLAPLPVGRGGMGRTVFLDGEFYVFGGETLNEPGAVSGTNVYDRVDIYDPEDGTWRLDRMALPRHGIDPVYFEGSIWIPGGGTVAGYSSSARVDEYVAR